MLYRETMLGCLISNHLPKEFFITEGLYSAVVRGEGEGLGWPWSCNGIVHNRAICSHS